MASTRSCVQQQLDEIELLRCCYPSSDEFFIDDMEAWEEAQAFASKHREDLQRNVSFIIKLHITEIQIAVEFQFIYSIRYPESPFDVHLLTYLPREHHQKFNEAVRQFLADRTPSQEPYIMEFLAWIQDNKELFLIPTITPSTTTTVEQSKKQNCRLWIYSHHIYNTEKRRNIIDWAHEFHLNGFSMPGKPGIICVEGQISDVEAFWSRLRSLTWKRLQMKEKEMLEENDICRFDRFEELEFVHDNSGRGGRADFGQFYQFLLDRHLEHIFNVYFGIDGRN